MRDEDFVYLTELTGTIANTFTRINTLARELAREPVTIKTSAGLRRVIAQLYIRTLSGQDDQAVGQTVLQELEKQYFILLRLEARLMVLRAKEGGKTIHPAILNLEEARYRLLSRFTLAGVQSDSELAYNSREYHAASLRLEVGDIAFFFFERLVNEIEKDDTSIPPTFWLAIQQWRCQGISAKARRSIQSVGNDLIVSEGRLNSPAPVYFVAHKDRRETRACDRPALVRILRQWGIIRIE